mgnify:CR=1 FL=1
MLKLDAFLLERVIKLAKIRGVSLGDLIEQLVTEAEVEAAYKIKQERDWTFAETPKKSLRD